MHAALWGLDLDQEFVYVGDEGIVEPSGKTRRVGLDFSLRYEILPWLFLDGDLNLTNPKSKEEAEGSGLHSPCSDDFKYRWIVVQNEKWI